MVAFSTVADVHLRPATAADADLLVEMVAQAADWRLTVGVRSPADVLADPGLARYAVGWPRAGDTGFVAQDSDGSATAAAWWRWFGQRDGGYGFVSEDVPEVSVAVRPPFRGHGIGGALLRRLIAEARASGPDALSLSVERANPALRLYLRLGFVEVGGTGAAATMLLRCRPARPAGAAPR